MAQRAPFARDEPVRLPDDAFGHRDYTETLVSIVSDDKPPPTVGVFGRWGVGKSTIIGGLQEQLNGGEIAFVYFDAWRYEGDSLRRQFLIDAANQLKNDGHLAGSYSPESKLRELHVDTQKLSESLRFSWTRLRRAMVIGLVFALVAVALALFHVFDRVLSGNFGSQVLASVLAFTIGTFAGLFSQTLVVSPTTVTTRALQDPDRFAQKFAELLAALRRKRVVIAVDNLDRCAPDKAVELLSTIKTYLEPTVAVDASPRSSATKPVDKEVVFVVSVDDQALRRHLLAQETARSRDSDEHVIRRYVDEYLAKFFSARLPIRSILPDDMRGYIAAHLQPLIAARGLGTERGKDLVSIVDAGLRHNPRSVKQFGNDLESRLRLLEERERTQLGRAAGISPAVSGEVCMVAKLALIEFEFPEAFDRLISDPLLLERWEARTESAEEVDWDADPEGAAPPAPELSAAEQERRAESRRAFATFLRQARSTQSPHLRALLRLKQSQSEVGLPGYAEFRAAAVGGDRARLESIFGESSDRDPDALVAQLPNILEEELASGYMAGARSVVDAVISLEVLESYEDVQREILTRAVRRPRLREQLSLLNPNAVLGGTALLEPADRANLLDPFVVRLLDDEFDGDQRRSAAEALGKVAGDLTADQSRRIREALSEPMRTSFALYSPLALAAPELLPAGTAGVALEALSAPARAIPTPEEKDPSLSAHPDAFAVAKMALAKEGERDLQRQALEHVAETFRAHAESAELAEDLDLAAELLEPLQALEPDDWSPLLDQILGSWSAYPRERHARILAFIGEFLPRANAAQQEALPAQIADVLFESPDYAIGLIGTLDPLPTPFREPFLARLNQLAADPDRSTAAVATVIDIAGEEAPRKLADLLVSLLERSELDRAGEVLADHGDLLGPELQPLADQAAPHIVERINSNLGLPPELLRALSERMSDAAMETLAEAMRGQLQAGAGQPSLEAIDQLHDRDAHRLRARFAALVLEALLGLGEIAPPHETLLAAACRNVDELDSEGELRLAGQLASWLRVQPGQAVLLAGNIATIPHLTAEPAKELVEALIEAERQNGDNGTRQQLLDAADAIRGASNTRATKALRKRLTELRQGSDFEQELAARFPDVIHSMDP